MGIKAILDERIIEFFPMQKGEFITDPLRIIPLAPNVCISRRALKHIVEQRSMTDGFDVHKIKSFLWIAHGVVINPQIIMENHNVKYPHSILLGRFDPKINKGIIVVLENSRGDNKNIVTIFCKEERQFRKIQKNSL